MSKKISIIALIIIVLAVLGAVFHFNKGKASSSTAEKRIVCTTFPVYLFAKNVMKGSSIQPELLISSDTGCPHDYVLTPKDMRNLSRGNVLLLKNGMGMDDHLCKAAIQAGGKIETADLSAGAAEKLAIAEKHKETAEHGHDDRKDHKDHDGHDCHGHHHHESENGLNPHIFASPAGAAAMVQNLVEYVSKFDSANKELYRKNGSEYLKKLNVLGKEIKNKAASVKDRRAAIQHSIFCYILHEMGMKEPLVISYDPSAASTSSAMRELEAEIRKDRIPVIFTEPQYSENTAKILSKETGASVCRLDPVATGPENAPDDYYEVKMRENADLIVRAFSVQKTGK